MPTSRFVCLLLFVLLSGCVAWETPEDRDPDYVYVLEQTLDAWRSRYDYITNGSADALARSVIQEVTADVLYAECGVCVGCYQTRGDRILILRGRLGYKRECTAAHEYLHLLSRYDLDDLQDDHSNPDLWEEFGDDSLETILCEILH